MVAAVIAEPGEGLTVKVPAPAAAVTVPLYPAPVKALPTDGCGVPIGTVMAPPVVIEAVKVNGVFE
jgi:hypothetical protein